MCGTTFTLVDTAGVNGERVSLLTSGDKVRNRDPMEVEMMRHTLKAAGDADLIFLLMMQKLVSRRIRMRRCDGCRQLVGPIPI